MAGASVHSLTKWHTEYGHENPSLANEVIFALTKTRNIMKNVRVLNTINVDSDHRMVRTKININLRKERRNFIRVTHILIYLAVKEIWI